MTSQSWWCFHLGGLVGLVVGLPRLPLSSYKITCQFSQLSLGLTAPCHPALVTMSFLLWHLFPRPAAPSSPCPF